MAVSQDAKGQLRAALEGLLAVEHAGRRLLYHEDATGDHGYCHACEEVDGHKDGCAVGIAQRVLRVVDAEP